MYWNVMCKVKHIPGKWFSEACCCCCCCCVLPACGNAALWQQRFTVSERAQHAGRLSLRGFMSVLQHHRCRSTLPLSSSKAAQSIFHEGLSNLVPCNQPEQADMLDLSLNYFTFQFSEFLWKLLKWYSHITFVPKQSASNGFILKGFKCWLGLIERN